jgi:glycosyltransferase involved in cell wall biosynthesis
MASEPSVCFLIPCRNEERGVGEVVREFREVFPGARILVVDNASTDATGRVARESGAEVLFEPRPGKARAVASALAAIDEDVVIMVDGDGTYPAEGARRLHAEYLRHPADMITGLRQVVPAADSPFRPFHQIGGSAFAFAIRLAFAHAPGDLFSGLRLFSKRFYKHVPLLFRGFELETELTIQAIDKGFDLAEVPVPFRERAAGTSSKLRTVRDGTRILRLIVVLFRDYRPLLFFSLVALLFFVAGAWAGAYPVREYALTHRVGRFPLAILAAALMTLSLFSLLTGVMLESGLRRAREACQIQLRNFRP